MSGLNNLSITFEPKVPNVKTRIKEVTLVNEAFVKQNLQKLQDLATKFGINVNVEEVHEKLLKSFAGRSSDISLTEKLEGIDRAHEGFKKQEFKLLGQYLGILLPDDNHQPSINNTQPKIEPVSIIEKQNTSASNVASNSTVNKQGVFDVPNTLRDALIRRARGT